MIAPLSASNVPIIRTSSAFEALFEGDVQSFGTLPAVNAWRRGSPSDLKKLERQKDHLDCVLNGCI